MVRRKQKARKAKPRKAKPRKAKRSPRARKVRKARPRKPKRAPKKTAKKRVVRKTRIVKKTVKKIKPKLTMRPVLQQQKEAAPEAVIGKVTHYYSHLSVGIIELTDTLRVGDTIRIKGATTNFVQTVESMEIDHRAVEEASVGQVIGIKVREHVRDHDVVYKVIE